jgi:hypothetical protein
LKEQAKQHRELKKALTMKAIPTVLAMSWVHDLNNSINNHNSNEWWKEYTTLIQHTSIPVKFMYYGVVGTMKLHDFTGWLKKQSTSQFKFMYQSVIGGMNVHDLTGWMKNRLFYCIC